MAVDRLLDAAAAHPFEIVAGYVAGAVAALIVLRLVALCYRQRRAIGAAIVPAARAGWAFARRASDDTDSYIFGGLVMMSAGFYFVAPALALIVPGAALFCLGVYLAIPGRGGDAEG